MNCKIPNCDSEVVYHHLKVCSACYAGLAYWRGRSNRDKEHRRKLTKRLTSRMEHMIDYPQAAYYPRKKRNR